MAGGIKRGRWLQFDPTRRSLLPRLPGVYVIFFNRKAVYVGQSVELRGRLSVHNIRPGYGTEYWTPWGRVPHAIEITGKYKLSVRYGDWAMWELRLIRRLSPLFNKTFVGLRGSAWHG